MRLALWGASALAAGIALADWLRPHPGLALVAVGVSAIPAAVARGRRAAVLFLLTVSFLGATHYAFDMTAGRGNLGAWEGQKVTLVGTVTEEPELRKPRGVGYVVRVERVDANSASGRLYVTQWSEHAPGFGHRIQITGTLKTPPGARFPGGFDRAAYLARQGIYLTLDTDNVTVMGPGAISLVRRAAVAARVSMENVLKRTLSPRDAALMAGLLFGSRTDLPADIRDAFRSSGVFHLLAVSGGNLAMVVIPVIGILRRTGVPQRWASAVAIPLVVFFVFLTGAGPSVLRAGLMAMLVLLGDVLRRERNALNTLGAAAFVLLLAQPALLFDLGFQLSVSATLGILLFARRIEAWFTLHTSRWFGRRVGPWLAAGLSVTIAAQLLVEPISLHSFGFFSTIAPLANLLVLAFLEWVVQVGMISALVGLALLPVAQILTWPVRLGLWLLVTLVKLMAAVPGAYLEVGRLPIAGVLAWYLVIAVVSMPSCRRWLAGSMLGAIGWWRTRAHRAKLGLVSVVALTVSTTLTWRWALADPPDLLQVHFIDIGQGDAVLIQAPGGVSVLVDAGAYVPPDAKSGRKGYDAGAEVILPYLASRGIKQLDYLILTHPDQDHAGGGASVLGGIPVGVVLKSDRNPTETRYLEALAVAARKRLPIRQPVAGETVRLGKEVSMAVLNPQAELIVGTRSDDNSNCLAFRLVYRQVAAIFTCDLEAVVEEQLVAQGVPLRADILKVSHHGSGSSTTHSFLKAVQPRWAVISVGNGNPFGHPHAATLRRLAEAGARVYRTDRHGTVIAKTDGQSFMVSGARGEPQDGDFRPIGLSGRRWLFAW